MPIRVIPSGESLGAMVGFFGLLLAISSSATEAACERSSFASPHLPKTRLVSVFDCDQGVLASVPSDKSSGMWIYRIEVWIHSSPKIAPNSDARNVPECAPWREANIWFLAPEANNRPSKRSCEFSAGSTVIFAAKSEVGLGVFDRCDDMYRLKKEELAKHQSVVSVYVDDVEMPFEAMWMNGAKTCFELDTGWSGMGVKRAGDKKSHWLAASDADGYFAMLTFPNPGTYTLRVVQRPHRRWQWQEKWSLDVTYVLSVTQPEGQ
ncbi:MAG: hypothetical protein ACJ8G2_01820 [Burkholderiales bacterium]|jgi:hypothetical protein